jgi:hypothetical protein
MTEISLQQTEGNRMKHSVIERMTELFKKQITTTVEDTPEIVDVFNAIDRNVKFLCPLIDRAKTSIMSDCSAMKIEVLKCAANGKVPSLCRYPVLFLESYFKNLFPRYITKIGVDASTQKCTILINTNVMEGLELL